MSNAFWVEFTRSEKRRIAVLGHTPEDAVTEARIRIGENNTTAIWESEFYITAEDADLVLAEGKPLSADPHTEDVLLDDGSIGCVTPTEGDRVWDWRGDRWCSNGHCLVVAENGPRVESELAWMPCPPMTGPRSLAAFEAFLADARECELGPWVDATSRGWEGSAYSQAVCAPARDGRREPVCDRRYIPHTVQRWTCGPKLGTPVFGWDGDRLVIATMPRLANRLVKVGPT